MIYGRPYSLKNLIAILLSVCLLSSGWIPLIVSTCLSYFFSMDTIVLVDPKKENTNQI